MTWLVLDMDEGLLRACNTRKEAVTWARGFTGGEVLERHNYGPGVYEYRIGYRGEDDATSLFIERRDKAILGGWDVNKTPAYPYPNHPYESKE